MIFSELYSAYYNTVAKIIEEAIKAPITKSRINEIINEKAFGESILIIEKLINDGTWPFLDKNNLSIIQNKPQMPLTKLQKMWLKAISIDPRIKLFNIEFPALDDVQPLFTKEDYCYFDKYLDGDNFEDENYIKNFKTILDGINNDYFINYQIENKKGEICNVTSKPLKIEYSEKDDKFRVININNRYGEVINISKIITCEKSNKEYVINNKKNKEKIKVLIFELIDERNSLERVLLHFAHFKKEVERKENNKYIVKIEYNGDDETEMVIRVLMFGPVIKVIEPTSFVDKIKEKLIMQKGCEL